MARWQNQRRSDNVERRGGQAVGIGLVFVLIRFIFSRFGIVGVVALVGGYFALKQVGIDPLMLLAGGSGQTQSEEVGSGEYDDEILAIVGSTEDFWNRAFQE